MFHFFFFSDVVSFNVRVLSRSVTHPNVVIVTIVYQKAEGME